MSKLLDKKTLSVDEIVKKFKVSKETVLRALEKGRKIEGEHTTHKQVADEIARDHLGEMPDYYDKLDKMEKKK